MFAPALRALSVAFTLTASAAALSHGQTNTMAVPQTTAKKILSALTPQELLLGSKRCEMQRLSYFDNKSIEMINKDLGDMRNWLIAQKLHDPSLMEQFLDEDTARTEEDKTNEQRFYGIFETEKNYEAGTDTGLAYLKKNPLYILSVTAAYIDHMEFLKTKLEPEHKRELQKTFGKTLKKLDVLIKETDNMMELQISQGCLIPVPGQPFPPAPIFAQ